MIDARNQEAVGQGRQPASGYSCRYERSARVSARLLGLDPENPDQIQISTPLVFIEHTIGEGSTKTYQLVFRSEL